MIPIKHIINENGVKEIFKLIVPSGLHAGTYEIEKPNGWDEVDSVVNIDEELFFVKDFIIGESEKLTFFQYSNKIAFNLLKAIYEEQKGDGIAEFKWIAEKDGIEYDLLKESFIINFNKYNLSFAKSMYKIEIELVKNEAQNKLFNREETTVDLFSKKDIDEKDINPVETFDIGYKKGSKVLENFYFATAGQERGNLTNEFSKFYVFSRSDDYALEKTNPQSGVASENNGYKQSYFGPFLDTPITLTSVKLSFSTFDIGIYTDNVNYFSNVYIHVLVTLGNTVVQDVRIDATKATDATFNYEGATYKGGRMQFNNIQLTLPDSLKPGSRIDIWLVSEGNINFKTILMNEGASITISSNLESPIVKTQGIRLKNAINQVVKSITSSDLSVISNILSENGIYYNTSISTGVYLRGLPAVYLSGKLKTSFKKLIQEGASKLLALGFDVLDKNVIVEDIRYFFKDFKVYDLSEKQYLWEGFKINNDSDIVYNTLLFGSKKYSTNKKDDIRNFNTVAEFTTPIKTFKNKFDKQTELIIDEYKIQEMIEDNSTRTNDNDDDLVLIDMVNVSDYWDTGVFENCIHSNVGGFLILNCLITPFDTTLIKAGSSIEIKEVLNPGIWTVLEVNGSKIKLNKTSGITEGNEDTPIRYKIDKLTKNRVASDGFSMPKNIRNPETSTNIRHNPKFQMARWFSWFGSGLRRKGNNERIKVTNYKNNSAAEIKCNTPELSNELPGLIEVGADETLGRLRSYDQTLFNGDEIEISYQNVTFEEFMDLYNNWKFGVNNDRMQNRGYISLNTPEGIFDAYPLGDGGFSHNKKTNVLSIKGKVKGKSTTNPTLLSVEQLTKDTVKLVWEYNEDYVNPVISIQYSLDGSNWTTLKEVSNVKTDNVQSNLFFNILTGTDVYFRVIVNTPDYYNKVSNSIMINWRFNDWKYAETYRSIDDGCGASNLKFSLYGTGTFEIDWKFLSRPGGGYFRATDDLYNELVSLYTPYGVDSDDTLVTQHTITNGELIFNVELKPTDNDGTNFLQCNYGGNLVLTRSYLFIKIKNINDNTEFNTDIRVLATKRYQPPGPLDPTDPIGEV